MDILGGVVLWFFAGYLALVFSNRVWHHAFQEMMPGFFMVLSLFAGPFGFFITFVFLLNLFADYIGDTLDPRIATSDWQRLLLWKKEI